jgi:DNA polymerase-3 subunit gamma/tau
LAYQSLYRKWRPQSFEEVVDQRFVVQTLSNALKSGRYSHAYLFAGPRGTGKTSIARILAKALNCEEGPTPHPCNRCESCRSITGGNALDVMEIDAASNRGIDDIRELRDKVSFSPADSRMKVYIVDEVHMLTTEAFNALLKMLEEPPAHAVFILATTEPHKVPATIASRCQRFDFQRVPTPELSAHLEKVAREEGIGLESGGALLISRAAQGSVRDALVTLDQAASFIEGEITAEAVGGFLGLVESRYLDELCEMVARGDGSGLLMLVAELERQGKDLVQFAREALERLRLVFLVQNTDAGPEFLDLSGEEYETLKRLAGGIDPGKTPGYLRIMQETAGEMRQSGNPRTVLEMGLVRLVRPEMELSVEALSLRLERLEEQLEELALELREGGLPAPAGEAVTRAGAAPLSRGTRPGRPEAAAPAAAGAQEVTGRESQGPAEEGPQAQGAAPPAQAEAPPAQAEAPPAKAAAPAAAPPALDIAAVKRGWSRVKERVKEKSLPVSVSFAYGFPAALKEGVLYLRFHADSKVSYEKMADEQARRLVEQCLQEVFHADLRLKPYLDTAARAADRARAEAKPGTAGRKPIPSPGAEEGSREASPAGEPEVSERGESGRGKAASPSSRPPQPGAGPPEAARPPGEKKPKEGYDKRHLVHLVTDVFDGAEVVEEIQLPPPEGDRLHE